MSLPHTDRPQPKGAPTLFQGARFWLSQTVPQRLKFKEQIQNHGGTVVLMEKDADVKLVDHTRKNLPDDTFSYQYVERSIQKGRLEDLEAHRAGPSSPRPMGASNIPMKGKRSFFTLKEDQILFDWILHFAQSPGAPVQGNKFYQDLGQLFPTHPWQSWRSRYTKHLIGKSRPGGGKPLSLDEIIQSAPSQGQRHKVLASRTSEQESTARTESKVLPPRTSAQAQEPLVNGSKRKRDSPPRPPNPSGTEVTPLKRRAVQVSTSAASPSRHPRRPSPEPQPRSPTTSKPPSRSAGLARDSPSASSSNKRPIDGLGIPGLFPSVSPQRVAPGPPQNPEDATKRPPAHTRPLGDNAFAKSGRFKRQEPKAKSIANDPYKDPVDPVFLELPFLPSSPASEASDEDAEEMPDVDSWIDARLARGANESHILDALRCTSMVPELADKVLGHISTGEGIPHNMSGVWTAEDDQCLQAKDHSEVQRALSKHGAKAYKERWEYLRMARQTGLIE